MHSTVDSLESGGQGGIGGALGGTGVDLSGYLEGPAIFSTPGFEVGGGFSVPPIDFNTGKLVVLALVYYMAQWQGLLVVGFLFILTQFSAQRQPTANAAGAGPAAVGTGTGAAAPALPAQLDPMAYQPEPVRSNTLRGPTLGAAPQPKGSGVPARSRLLQRHDAQD